MVTLKDIISEFNWKFYYYILILKIVKIYKSAIEIIRKIEKKILAKF